MSDTPLDFAQRFDQLTSAQQELVYLRLRDVVEARLIARTRAAIERREQRPLHAATRIDAIIDLN